MTPIAASVESHETILVAITSGDEPRKLVLEGHRLAMAFGVKWRVLHIDTEAELESDGRTAAEALSLATELGASIVSLPAATIFDGLLAALHEFPVKMVIIPLRFIRSGRLARDFGTSVPGVSLHLIPTDHGKKRRRQFSSIGSHNLLLEGVWLVAGTVMAVAAAAALRQLTGIASISLVFLFPVIAAAARQTLRAVIATALVSAFLYNFTFIEPVYTVKPWLSQNWFMALVLALVGVYTSFLTQRLRRSAVLSDRSARQNAGLAALASELTHQNSWAATADVLARHVAQLFDVECAILYQKAGRPEVEASFPHPATFGPVDLIALDWCWSHHEQAGSGTGRLYDANWLFQPLKTEVGLLGVIGVARADGRPPIGPSQQLLFSTVVAQAALAHERLALEDKARF